MSKSTGHRLNIMRVLFLLGAMVLILFFLPHPDRQSYSYELNQPWKYPLLMADFDMPILRDSASAHRMRDSIDAAFVPFVRRDPDLARDAIDRFAKNEKNATPIQSELLSRSLAYVYNRGIVEQDVYQRIMSRSVPRLREMGIENGAPTVVSIDASQMLSPRKAFEYIDSVYRAEQVSAGAHPLSKECIRSLNEVIIPNIVVDTAANAKFISQEYIAVNGAQGLIKKGQRIVDRGEIITPQIFTNLNTYIEMLDRSQEGVTGHTYFFIGQALYIFICFLGLYVFLYIFRPEFFKDLRKIGFLVCFITVVTVACIIMAAYFANGLLLVPFAMVPVVVMIFFDARTAIFSLFVAVMISALVAVFPLQFIFIQLAAGLTASFAIHQLSQRSQLLRVALLTFVAYLLSYATIVLATNGTISLMTWRTVGCFAINSVILSFAYILILVVEKLFGFTSMVTLVELSDINNPLLRRLASEAPGTFQHSIQVSTLASEAARAIGANSQLVRTGALYHDVGKLESPIFFTENQHGVNPHTGLNPETSARKIISHVTDGLAIARQANLPQVVRNFISEHHGKGVAKYFYTTAVNENNGEPVDKAPFTYPGPNPQSRETAILMMADCVEAASRSLPEYSKATIDSLVDRIIDGIVTDGMLKDAPISFRDLRIVKDTFKERLATIYHSRIAYPKAMGGQKSGEK